MMMWTSLIHFLLFQYVPTHTNAFLAQQRQPHRSTISTRTSTAVVVDQPLRPSLFATVERKSDSFSTNSDDFSGRRRQQQQVIIQHQTASTRPRVQPISSYATPTFHSAAQTQRLQQQQQQQHQQQQLSDSQNERNSYSYQEDTDINGANELANLRRRWAILDQRQQQQQSKLAAIRKNVIEISQRRQERWSASRAHTANISSGHVAHRSAVSPPNNTSYHSIQFSDPSSSTRHPQRVSANRHMQIPTIPRVGTTILPQQRTLSQSSPIAKTFLTECMSIDVAKPTDDKPIANLRAEVFGERVNGGHLESFKRKFVHRTCDFLHERRKMGTTCLTASINYMDANPWLVGSIECSTHEVRVCCCGCCDDVCIVFQIIFFYLSLN